MIRTSEVRGGGPGRAVPPTGAPSPPAGRAGERRIPGGPRGPRAYGDAVGPLARAAELELRLREETLRRERAEARAVHAESQAEIAGARVARLEARVAEAEDARATEAAEQQAVITALRRGLAEVGAELDALHGLAAEGAAATVAGEIAEAARALRPRATDPSIRMGELARGARELLAGGRIEAADEVIRGLEDAAERLRAQAPTPPPED